MEIIGVFQAVGAKAYWSLSHQCITVPKIITGSCSDAKRVKMAEKPQKNSKEIIVLKRLVKQPLAMRSFKNWVNI